jgi:hypothetical protein
VSIYLDSNSNWYDWAEENGYDSDTEYDLEEEVFKRGAHVSCYFKKDDDTYALVTWYSDYDNGRMDIEVQKEGLHRYEEQVVTTKIIYK